MSTVDNAGRVWDYGLQPWPVQHDGSKAPRGNGWSRDELPERLSREATLEMFRPTDTGMGVITGLGHVELFEFEGRFVADDGWDEFISACNDRDLGELLEHIRQGYEVASPSGGIHLMFRTEGPAAPNTVLAGRDVDGTILPLIETRGDRGFAILAGSNGQIHPQGGSWRMLRGKPRTIATIATAERDALYELAREFDEAPEKPAYAPELRKGGSGIGLESGGDYSELNEQIDVRALLVEAGWTHVKTKRTGSELWRRPGKNWGNSGELWPDGVLSVYTSTLPQSWREALNGKEQLSPVGLLAAVRHSGDFRAAASATRRSMTVNAEPVVDASGGGLNLPEEFWEQRDFLGHIRDAALDRMTSPDAVLVSCLARYAALVPPSVLIPAIVGSTATFDFIGCVVAKSSGGKTIANGVAEELIHTTDPKVLMSAPIGSGEGLVQAFMGWEKNDKGKKVGDPSYKFGDHHAIHFNSDEATAIMEQTARQGTTIVQTLCSAWSGAALGQLNASVDTKRIVPAKKRRVAACLNIQTLRGHELLDDRLRAVGFPQRILFAWAHAELPADLPDWPGVLRLKIPGGLQEVTFADAIAAEVRAERRAVMAGALVRDELDGHVTLLRMKVAGLLTMLDGRFHVTEGDWNLAGSVVECSSRVRRVLIEAHSASVANQVRSRAAGAVLYNEAVEEHTDLAERKKVDKLADAIAKVVGDGTLSVRKVARATTSTATRHRFEVALEQAVERGLVEVDGDHVSAT